jgi:hypothetical protein
VTWWFIDCGENNRHRRPKLFAATRNEIKRRYPEHDHDIDVSFTVFGFEELDEFIFVLGAEKTICVEMLGKE